MNAYRFVILSSVAALALFGGLSVAVPVSEAQDKSARADDKDAKVQLMFVQTAEDLKVDADKKTLRLVKVNQQTLYFSDRPVRIAGSPNHSVSMGRMTLSNSPSM